jgi:predicted ATP-dependent endonuclease of OLD family
LGLYLSIVLSEVISLDFLDEEYTEFNLNEFVLFSENGESLYSSGQMIMILTLSEVLAYITIESLILFDEPETHLHPNSVSLFIQVLNKILSRFDSYAIISTHSPQFIQEVPAKDITILERLGNTPSTRQLDIETFGENLNILTERVFSTSGHDEYYRNYLLSLFEKIILSMKL